MSGLRPVHDQPPASDVGRPVPCNMRYEKHESLTHHMSLTSVVDRQFPSACWVLPPVVGAHERPRPEVGEASGKPSKEKRWKMNGCFQRERWSEMIQSFVQKFKKKLLFPSSAGGDGNSHSFLSFPLWWLPWEGVVPGAGGEQLGDGPWGRLQLQAEQTPPAPASDVHRHVDVLRHSHLQR